MIIQYFLFYLPGNKGEQFSKEVRRLLNQHRKEDIMEYVGYLNDIPWLEQKLQQATHELALVANIFSKSPKMADKFML